MTSGRQQNGALVQFGYELSYEPISMICDVKRWNNLLRFVFNVPKKASRKFNVNGRKLYVGLIVVLNRVGDLAVAGY